MKRVSTAELRCLEVINLCGGEKLGYICDFEIDIECGNILSLIVRDQSSFSVFGKNEEYIIPWCNIECFGEDAILIKLSKSELDGCSCSCKKEKRRGFFR